MEKMNTIVPINPKRKNKLPARLRPIVDLTITAIAAAMGNPGNITKTTVIKLAIIERNRHLIIINFPLIALKSIRQ